MITFENFSQALISWFVNISLKILAAAVLLFVSFRIITILSRRFEKKLLSGKRPFDKTLTTAILYTARIILKSVVVICLVGYLGVDTSGLAALVASLGVGVGLAVNGALSNLAGGVLLIITRPFKIDDFIEFEGKSGTVEDIHITMTRIRTPDNKVVYIPNGKLSSDTIINYSEKSTRRVDLAFSLDPAADTDYIKPKIASIIEAHPLSQKNPEPFVRVSARGEEGVVITARVWCKNEDYWTLYFDILENTKAFLDSEHIGVPRRKIDVNVNK